MLGMLLCRYKVVVNLGNGRLKKVIHKEKSSAHWKESSLYDSILKLPSKTRVDQSSCQWLKIG